MKKEATVGNMARRYVACNNKRRVEAILFFNSARF
jgi:hypothetical protein